ncbi:39541_t:CDS:2 [Gigaspora margarita]|uniref:39541_t:CDS:1 n=1 Tax=Gigaspora margarita TaxID=4874 RepID=A0ABN7V5Y0_GIGMA|nr:39541_t:CDS:2 [Gigaspora margarita]
MNKPSTAYVASGYSENVGSSSINDEKVDPDISESESVEGNKVWDGRKSGVRQKKVDTKGKAVDQRESEADDIDIGDVKSSDINEDIELDPDEYYVERILMHRTGYNGKLEYLLKWRDYAEETWEEESNIFAKNLITDYWLDRNYSSSPHSLCSLDSEEYSSDEDDLDFDVMCEPTKKSQDFCCLQDMITEETKKDIDTNKMSSDISVDININQNERDSEKSRRVDNLQVDSIIKLLSLGGPYVRVNGRFLVDFRRLKIERGKRRQYGKKSTKTVHWADDVYNRCPQKVTNAI